MTCTQDICGRLWHPAGITVECIHIHTLQLSPHNGTQSPMQQAQRACPHLRSLPYPVSRGDRPRRWVASLLPNQPRPLGS